ncbi:MAG: hypothetical protein ABI205_07255 [Gemmatimonadaceae bacterium]
MSDYEGNITERGVRRRRVVGVIALVIALALLAALLVLGAPRLARLVLVVPFGIAALGFFQAREKTCVALGAAGTREVEGAGTCPLPSAERGAVSARVTKILLESLGAAVLATVVAVWI